MSHAKIPVNKLHAISPHTTPIGDSVQPPRPISICIIFVVKLIIPPGTIQTKNEQIIQKTAAVIALANPNFNELIFIIFISLRPVYRTPQKLLLNAIGSSLLLAPPLNIG